MLNVLSLREQVYQHLRNAIQKGALLPGTSMRLENLADELGVSKTPLKEALIRLECEGFVEVHPRHGVLIKKLTYQEIKDYYEIVGSLESSVLFDVFDLLTDSHVREMKESNEEQRSVLESGDFDGYYQLNLDFHDIFLKLSPNTTLRRMIMPLKQRLYDFPRRVYWKEWEYVNLKEHAGLIHCIESGDRKGAAGILKEDHWGWRTHEPYITKFYALTDAMSVPPAFDSAWTGLQIYT
jgi:DNA-binding GntR family transcriptional regulator